MQEFVTRGRGTPVPFDPPRHIVTTGVYAYVANPMQLSAVLFLFLLALIIGNVWVASAALIAHVYSVGLAGWDEEADLRERFGADWPLYRQRVRKWIPRWRPWYGETAIATLYVSAECGVCRQVAAWFEARNARARDVLPAEECAVPLTRITHQSTDGTYTASGIRDRANARTYPLGLGGCGLRDANAGGLEPDSAHRGRVWRRPASGRRHIARLQPGADGLTRS